MHDCLPIFTPYPRKRKHAMPRGPRWWHRTTRAATATLVLQQDEVVQILLAVVHLMNNRNAALKVMLRQSLYHTLRDLQDNHDQTPQRGPAADRSDPTERWVFRYEPQLVVTVTDLSALTLGEVYDQLRKPRLAHAQRVCVFEFCCGNTREVCCTVDVSKASGVAPPQRFHYLVRSKWANFENCLFR